MARAIPSRQRMARASRTTSKVAWSGAAGATSSAATDRHMPAAGTPTRERGSQRRRQSRARRTETAGAASPAPAPGRHARAAEARWSDKADEPAAGAGGAPAPSRCTQAQEQSGQSHDASRGPGAKSSWAPASHVLQRPKKWTPRRQPEHATSVSPPHQLHGRNSPGPSGAGRTTPPQTKQHCASRRAAAPGQLHGEDNEARAASQEAKPCH